MGETDNQMKLRNPKAEGANKYTLEANEIPEIAK
jgi:hypothetical protein